MDQHNTQPNPLTQVLKDSICYENYKRTAENLQEDLAMQIVELRKENEQCKEMLSKFLQYMDDGVIVRDISRDHEPDWAIKMLRFTTDLVKAYKLLEPK